MTREKIDPNVLIVNRVLKNQIEQWKQSKGITVDDGKKKQKKVHFMLASTDDSSPQRSHFTLDLNQSR